MMEVGKMGKNMDSEYYHFITKINTKVILTKIELKEKARMFGLMAKNMKVNG